MKPSYVYAIRPRLPEKLSFLGELALNLWWSWNFEAIEVFRRIEPALWDDLGQNPVLLLGQARQDRLDALAQDENYLHLLERVRRSFSEHMEDRRWFQQTFPDRQDLLVAYFSAEFGLARCLPVYSGGLGVLAGDHLKTASDMGLPLVGVGLAYRQGYFHQYLNIDGWQQERYDENDFTAMPIAPVLGPDGAPLSVAVPWCSTLGPQQKVMAALWKIQVGRVPLYLLSTNLPQNHADDRAITSQLYGGDNTMRVRQEIVLGIGGRLALDALGIHPSVFHMNEGHSAFLPLERGRMLMQKAGLDFDSALEASRAGNIFTTHTPVPAGNDRFDEALLKRLLTPLAEQLGCGWERFMDLGRDPGSGDQHSFCMTVSALRTASFTNAVARLHGSTSRQMWQSLWPGVPVDEVPIGPVTNGIHLYSWLSHDMAELFDLYVDPLWRSNPIAPGLWNRIHEIPDEELWRTHQTRRARLVAFARRRLQKHLLSRGLAPEDSQGASEVLNAEALTIGFARRFATYKRATLLLRDIDRLRALVSDSQQPVQFIFAGKAHPRDDEGKRFIRELVHAFRDPALRSRLVFLEDYDLTIARYMVQGCDVWLNTPRRPLEASGTSGMKAVANGGLHLSTLDGWWDQAYDPCYGWAIGSGEVYDDTSYQDEVEGNALYDLLETQVRPLFYQRSAAGLPREWIQHMKRSMSSLIPRFTSHRMLRNYIEEGYLPAQARSQQLAVDSYAGARELAGWRSRVEKAWPAVRLHNLEVSSSSLNGAMVMSSGDARGTGLLVGEELRVQVEVDAAGLAPADLLVEVYRGSVNSEGGFSSASGIPMELDAQASTPQRLLYRASLSSPLSGLFGFTVRVMPSHPALPGRFAAHLVTWAEDEGVLPSADQADTSLV